MTLKKTPWYPSRILMTDVNYSAPPKRIPRDTLIVIRGTTMAEQEAILRLWRHYLRCYHRSALSLSYNAVLLARYRHHVFGVHFPERLRQRQPWRMKQKTKFITSAWHGDANRKQSFHDCYAVILSPVMPTATHPQQKALGLAGVRFILRMQRKPCYLMGGLNGLPRCFLHHRIVFGWSGTRAFFREG